MAITRNQTSKQKKYVDLICQTSLFADKCINLTEIFQITQRRSKRQNSINAETIHVLNESYKKSNLDKVVVVGPPRMIQMTFYVCVFELQIYIPYITSFMGRKYPI